MGLVALAGSERTLPTGASILGRANPQAIIQATVHVKPATDRLASFVRAMVDNRLSQRQHLSRDEYAATHGAAPSDIQKIRRFAREHGVRVVRDRLAAKTKANPLAHRTVQLRGTLGAFGRAFGVKLLRVRDAQGRMYRTYNGPLNVPEGFQDVISNVFNLDTRPQAQPHTRSFPRLGGFDPHIGSIPRSPNEIARLYNFPTGVTGKGQTIAIIELGGGYRLRDLRTYFKQLGMSKPAVSTISVAGGHNTPTGNPDGNDSEVMLDLEVAGAVANGARFVMYRCPNTNGAFFRAVNTAIHDKANTPSILSISWGGPEATWSARDMSSFTEAFQAAAAMGVSVFVAAGDSGSTDGVEGSAAHVDFPASSPYATACGGTRLVSADGQSISSESVWNDGPSGGTGGGVSDVFDLSQAFYQAGSNVPPSVNPGAILGRGVPDVAGNADPVTGYKVRIDGVDTVYGGTSAVAPLWAGLFALFNESLGQSVGFANPLLYSPVVQTPQALRDITQGNNDTTGQVGGYSARPGWDPCTGLGTPNGAVILNALRA
jgi:kumamolisin